ncbi:MAG: hypothetical protein V2A58_09485 [Planctomycetota bacterium]
MRASIGDPRSKLFSHDLVDLAPSGWDDDGRLLGRPDRAGDAILSWREIDMDSRRLGVVAVFVSAFALAGCGGPRLDVAPSIVPAEGQEEFFTIDKVSLVDQGSRQFVNIRMSVWKDLPSPLVYDVIALGDVTVSKNVPTGVSGEEPGGRELSIPVEKSFAGGKLLFHLLEVAASAPASL